MGSPTSTGLSGRTGIVIDIRNEKSIDLNVVLDALNINAGINWNFGADANQANLLFHDSDSGDESSGLVVNVNDGSLKTPFGDGVSMEALKLLYVKNTHASLGLQLLGGSTPIAICANLSDIIVIPPGGFFLWADPSAAGLVTTSNFFLKFLAATSGTVTFDYAILGTD